MIVIVLILLILAYWMNSSRIEGFRKYVEWRAR
jgi:hypothetical protein